MCSGDNFISASVHWTNISFLERFTACQNKQKVKLTLRPSTMQWRHFLKCAGGAYTPTVLPLGEEPPVPTSQETVNLHCMQKYTGKLFSKVLRTLMSRHFAECTSCESHHETVIHIIMLSLVTIFFVQRAVEITQDLPWCIHINVSDR